MNEWLIWTVPYGYIRRYCFLMIGVLFILPMLIGLRYVTLVYVLNYFFADALFYHWCIEKIEEDKAEIRRKFFDK